ncbi:MAG: sensor histidine kinase [Phycisphaerales bacterium]|nr:MAG: sensor histidine kinase [Phycisphaerales bacterium]
MRESARENWRFAILRSWSIWVGVLSLGLVSVGLVLSYEQALLMANDRIEGEQRYSKYLVSKAQDEFTAAVRLALNESIERMIEPQRPMDEVLAAKVPRWIVATVLWDGMREMMLVRPEALGLLHPSAMRRALETRRLQSRLDDRVPLLERPGALQPAGPAEPVTPVYDDLADTPLLLASVATTWLSEERPAVLAAVIHKARLREDLIEPLIGGGRLELVTEYPRDSYWFEPLNIGLRFWAVRPSAEFIREQRANATRQILIHWVITIPSVIVVLVMLWFMFRLARRELALSQMKSNFVADVTHELKTPLALIRMFGETLLEGRVTTEDKRQEYYRVIMRESSRLTHLIDNILDFSRVEAAGRQLQLAPHDAAEVVRETYESYQFELDHAGFEHRLKIADGLPVVSIDRNAITQALINLISNAVKYSDDDRFLGIDVECDTRRGARGVLISVHDRGIGIRPEDRAHVFDGFFRASDARVRERRGTGLGLALVKQIVEDHGGSVWVESRLVKGSTFRIFLPAGAAGQIPAGQAAQTS